MVPLLIARDPLLGQAMSLAIVTLFVLVLALGWSYYDRLGRARAEHLQRRFDLLDERLGRIEVRLDELARRGGHAEDDERTPSEP